jgi:thiosulfate dehydrogenase
MNNPDPKGDPKYYPPLWGPRSYNIGAGMARLRTAAAFIREQMPYDRAVTLTDQEAFDVAAYINAQPRPDFRGKENDWPNGDPPPDAAYQTRAASTKSKRR